MYSSNYEQLKLMCFSIQRNIYIRREYFQMGIIFIFLLCDNVLCVIYEIRIKQETQNEKIKSEILYSNNSRRNQFFYHLKILNSVFYLKTCIGFYLGLTHTDSSTMYRIIVMGFMKKKSSTSAWVFRVPDSARANIWESERGCAESAKCCARASCVCKIHQMHATFSPPLSFS